MEIKHSEKLKFHLLSISSSVILRNIIQVIVHLTIAHLYFQHFINWSKGWKGNRKSKLQPMCTSPWWRSDPQELRGHRYYDTRVLSPQGPDHARLRVLHFEANYTPVKFCVVVTLWLAGWLAGWMTDCWPLWLFPATVGVLRTPFFPWCLTDSQGENRSAALWRLVNEKPALTSLTEKCGMGQWNIGLQPEGWLEKLL